MKKDQLCQICRKSFSKEDLFPISLLRSSVKKEFEKAANIDNEGYICEKDLKNIRLKMVEALLKEEKGAISKLDKKILKSYREQDFIAENVNKKFQKQLTLPERISDMMANFGGSWKFIIIFFSFILIWMGVNIFILVERKFDPYPFILLNLFLSCLAAIQAPIILMSQNRQAEKDKLQTDDNYITNLKAEIEIKNINSKLDLLMKKQWSRLLEIQNLQLDLVEDLHEILKKNNKNEK